jgi:hypothetical protein
MLRTASRFFAGGGDPARRWRDDRAALALGHQQGRGVVVRGRGVIVGGRGAVAAQPLTSVGAHALDERHQRPPLVGEDVLDARRNLGEGLTLDDALLLQGAQPQREGAGTDSGERALQLAEARTSLSEVANDEQRPLATDDLSRPTDRTRVSISH